MLCSHVSCLCRLLKASNLSNVSRGTRRFLRLFPRSCSRLFRRCFFTGVGIFALPPLVRLNRRKNLPTCFYIFGRSSIFSGKKWDAHLLHLGIPKISRRGDWGLIFYILTSPLRLVQSYHGLDISVGRNHCIAAFALPCNRKIEKPS